MLHARTKSNVGRARGLPRDERHLCLCATCRAQSVGLVGIQLRSWFGKHGERRENEAEQPALLPASYSHNSPSPSERPRRDRRTRPPLFLLFLRLSLSLFSPSRV